MPTDAQWGHLYPLPSALNSGVDERKSQKQVNKTTRTQRMLYGNAAVRVNPTLAVRACDYDSL